ncbi:MAG: hypothetical protein WCT24_00035 [Patescibacteria group bacterium]|jgi:hypothetical protein
MELPVLYLLIPFGLVILLTTLFVMFNFFHIAHFGLQGTKTALVLVGYIAIYVCALMFVFQILSSFDWSQTIVLPDLFSFKIPLI